MKDYWHIPGPRNAPRGPCIGFYKYDGNNIRAEWSKKQGWYKFGSRNQLIDITNEYGAHAIPLFMNKYADDLARVFTNNKLFPQPVKSAVVFLELHGPNSFCGVHVPGELLDVTLIDVNIHKKGFVLPKDFIRLFGHLDIAQAVYQGDFNDEFIEDVRAGKYPSPEGIVVKGVLPGGNPQHHLWMAKVKTRWWLQQLKERVINACYDDGTSRMLAQVLKDNLVEQE